MYDLHDGPSQLFVIISLLTSRYLEELPTDSRWHQRLVRLAELSEEGKWQLDQIARGMRTQPADGQDLSGGLSELAARFEADSGISTRVVIKGKRRQVGAGGAQALHRVAHLALVNAWKHARCDLVCVELDHLSDAIKLAVRDDGIGLGRRWETKRCRLGFASMRRTMEAVGGSFRVKAIKPHGVGIHARVPDGDRE